MPKVRYVGPFDVVVLLENGLEVERRKTIEVGQDLHDALVAQSDWETVEVKKKNEESA